MADYRDPEFEYYQNYYNKANETSARNQMEFQKMMSDTAHQREVKDLMKAGLNPALSLNNGASSPSGAYSSVDSSPNTARSQMAITKKEIAAQLKMNDQSLANAYKIAKYQSMVQERMNKYSTDMSYALGVLQSQLGYESSIYGSDMSKLIAGMNIENPSTFAGILREWLNGASEAGSGRKTSGFRESTVRTLKGIGKVPGLIKKLIKGNSKGKSSGRGNSARAVTSSRKNVIVNGRQRSSAKSLAKFGTGNIGYVPQGIVIGKDGLPLGQSKNISSKVNYKGKIYTGKIVPRKKALKKIIKQLKHD